jgi:prepilin-type processing-associated H-X9-DG protein/prepilin-type N-terminal cleavage/methylation domain-containing protein
LKNHRLSHRGLSLVELLVSVLVILVIAAVAVPIGKGMMERSHAANCSRNLSQIGIATMLYAGDHNFQLPRTVHQRRQGGISWTISLQPYTASKLVFRCERDPHPNRPYSYVINDFLTPNPSGASHLDFSRLSKLTAPHSIVMFAEAAAGYAGSDHFHFSPYEGVAIPPETFRRQVDVELHGRAANYLFADGHVETLDWIEVKRRLSEATNPFVDPTLRPQ